MIRFTHQNLSGGVHVQPAAPAQPAPAQTSPVAADVSPRETEPAPPPPPSARLDTSDVPPKPKRKKTPASKRRNWGTRFKLHGHNTTVLLLAFLVSSFFLLPSAFADLTATVTPGYQFSSNERPDATKLNRLGTPTILITGTLSGTNAGITAGSINGTMFAASVVDNDTINFTNSSPQAIAIKAEGVKARELNRLVAGDGLLGGAGTNLSVNIDSNSLAVLTLGYTLRVTNDVLTLATNLSPRLISATANTVLVGGPGNAGTNVPMTVFQRMLQTNALFTTSTYSISAGLIINEAHGLNVKPTNWKFVYVCVTTDEGYAEGDEIDIQAASNNSGSSLATYGVNSTNMFFSINASFANLLLFNKTTGAAGAMTPGNWRVKGYATP